MLKNKLKLLHLYKILYIAVRKFTIYYLILSFLINKGNMGNINNFNYDINLFYFNKDFS